MITDTYAYLSNLLGYPLHVPDAPITNRHRIGFHNQPKYIPPKERQRKPQDRTTERQCRVWAVLIKQKEPVCAADLCAKVGYTRNHCSIVLTELFRSGKVNRIAQRVGKTRSFFYTVKEGVCL